MKTDGDTKTKILDTAEIFFANKGLTGTSIRTIVREAGVNIAAIHYHFGSKEALFEAVLARRLAPVNEDRLRLLDRLEAEYPSGPLPLEPVIEAFMDPVVRLRFESSHGGDLFPKLLGRAHIELDKKIGTVLHSIFETIIERFTTAFSRALPELDREEIVWRIHCMVGVMSFTMIIGKDDDVLMHSYIDLRDSETVIKRLTAFTAAGMRDSTTKTSWRERE